MKKILVTLLTLAMLLTALAGPAMADDKVVLNWWVTDVATLVDIYQSIADAYMAEHPDIEIRLSSFPDEYGDKMAAAQAAGEVPDIYIEEVLANGASSGQMLDLTPYMERDGFDPEEIYYQPYMDYMCKFEDHYYALPRDVFSVAVVYNKDLFDAAGVPYPQEGWTLDEFVETARQLTKPESRQYGVCLPDVWSLFGFMWSFGADMCNEDATAASGVINSENTVRFFQFLQDLAAVEGVSPTMQTLQSFDGGENLFLQGQVAMVSCERYSVGTFVEAEMNIGAVSFPIVDEGAEWTYASAPSWSISATTKHPDEAWDFLKFAYGPEGSRMLASTKYFFPAVKGVAEELDFLSDEVEQVFFNQLDESRSTKLAFWWRRPENWVGFWEPPILDSWDFAWEEILMNDADVQETLDNAADEIDAACVDYAIQTGHDPAEVIPGYAG